jgi:hypothetical protein
MFEGPNLKIKRANKHISELEEAVELFSNGDSHGLRLYRDPGASEVMLDYSQIKDTPCDWPLIIGDAIHNLRSALDLAIVEFIGSVGGAATKHTRFQFFNDRNHLVTSLEQAVLKGLPTVIEFLADKIQPYLTGDNPLKALHDLDIDDKHLLLIPILSVSWIGFEQIYIIRPDGSIHANLRGNKYGTTMGGKALNIVAFPASNTLKIEGKIYPTFYICFGKGQAFENQPVIPTLRQLAQFVTETVEKFRLGVISLKTMAS